jgi:glycogen phosphorylase
MISKRKHYFSPLVKSKPNKDLTELPPLGMDAKTLTKDFRNYFSNTLGRDKHCKTTHYPYKALATILRERITERWKRTQEAYNSSDCKRTYYLSLEFLMGRATCNSLFNLGLDEEIEESFVSMGLDIEEILDAEPDAGLGNGGLGRLAACFLDSCATLQLPVKGYGLRYEYGMFTQHIEDGEQTEAPDHWLRDGNPWEMDRPEYTQRIKFCGRTESYSDFEGKKRTRWVDCQDVLATHYYGFIS